MHWMPAACVCQVLRTLTDGIDLRGVFYWTLMCVFDAFLLLACVYRLHLQHLLMLEPEACIGCTPAASMCQVLRALADGIDVRGFFYWTLMDNFEWSQGFNMKVWGEAPSCAAAEHSVSPGPLLSLAPCLFSGCKPASILEPLNL